MDTRTVRTMDLKDLPPQLSHIPKPPSQLWVEGALPDPSIKFLTVVGSRALSSYGRTACTTLIRGLAGYPVSIVSGLALGTDGCAHQAALDAGLHTIAIPGSGLGRDVLGPRLHLPLADRIVASGGALLSEHPPDYTAHPYDFPCRNRIMIGLSHAVLMVEAGPDSGTLISAGLAGEYGRELLIVPHRITDQHGYGMARFARIGATIVTESCHILEALGIEVRSPSSQLDLLQNTYTPDELAILRELANPHSLDVLCRSLAWTIQRTAAALSALEMRGLIVHTGGFWHSAGASHPSFRTSSSTA